MQLKINTVITIMCIFAVMLVACTKTKKDAYKDYMAGGEIFYPGRVDSAIVQAGYKRVQISILPGNDPQVKLVRIYWNNKADSVDVVADHTKDTLKVVIPNLTEGNYNFVIYTFDSGKNKSVVFNASGIVYGDSYAGSLTNRSIKSVTPSKDGKTIQLVWGEPASGELGTVISYIGIDGATHQITTLPETTTTTLPDYQEKSKLTFHSLYKPDSAAFDFFSPADTEITLPAFEKEFSKAGFNLLILPTDVLDGGYGWLQQYLWDEQYNPPGFATQNKIPCWFTIDAGVSASISRFKVWQANDRLFDKESVKTFELYGSNSPATDGSWDNWTLIGSYASVKPSGQPVGNNTQADIAYAKVGEEFTAPAATGKFRYYRFKLLSNWGNSGFMTMEEFTFYTHDR
jgi:hypothetical protein